MRFAVGYAALLLILCKLLNFNGLYGQDAHEYLRQGKLVFDRLQGLGTPAPGLGDAEFAGGYPLAGALLRFVLRDAGWAMLAVSALSAGLALLFFERCLRLLAPGARPESRWVFAALGLALAPYFLRAGLTVMSDALGLALCLAALAQGLALLGGSGRHHALGCAVCAVGAVTVRFGLLPLLLPLLWAVGRALWRRGLWPWLLGMVLLALLATLPHFWLKNGISALPLQHSMAQRWSLWHAFQSVFSNENGHSTYLLPNGLYVLLPLMHPGFCLSLPGLWLLAKRTDWLLPSKHLLLWCLGGYLLLLVGLPHQNMRFLLPAYALLLLLLFPAWDRMYAYGLYFFPRLTRGVLAGALLLQLAGALWVLRPVLARHKLERRVASALRDTLPAGAALYAFDLDVAMRSYLPDIQHFNLWERRYAEFPAGGYVLFNEAKLARQWAGQNPMLNWEALQQRHTLQPLQTLPEGWTLFLMTDER
jgi:hypothetical protein